MIKKIVISSLLCGAVIMVSGMHLHGAFAKQKAEEQQHIFESYGDTKVIAVEPVDVLFSHNNHVIAEKMACDACHPRIFKKKRGAAAAQGNYDMKAMEEGLYCGACHNEGSAFGVVEETECSICHTGPLEPPKIVINTEPVEAVIFDHAGHLNMGMDCADCHNHIFEMRIGHAEKTPEHYTMQALYDGQYCGACHNGKDAFASDTLCTSCHIGVQGRQRMFAESAAKSHGDH